MIPSIVTITALTLGNATTASIFFAISLAESKASSKTKLKTD
jgi:hypothetical protein